jgi:hypothetical protein
MAEVFCITILLFVGCQRSSTPPPLTKIHLLNLNLAYSNFCATNGRSPSNLDELAPFVVTTVFPESHRKREEETLRELREGNYVVVWKQQGALEAKQGTDIVTGYEKRTPETGGFVVFADGRVERMSAEELERRTRRDEH